MWQAVKRRLRRWTKPNSHLILNVAADLTRSRAELVLENAFLRQQLVILERHSKRPALTQRDRVLFVLLASKLRSWKQALVIVQPDTLLRWHRDLFRWAWKHRSRPRRKGGRAALAEEIVALIKRMAVENQSWGADRIRGELLKLGIRVAKSTIQRYTRDVREPRSPRQNWLTFLQNHAGETWACDFVQTYELFFRAVFVFVMVELASRRVVHYGVTRHPTDRWVSQQLREATPFGEGPRYLLRDNDSKYGTLFGRVAVGTGIEMLRTPYRVPKANAICERFVGSLRRERLDNFLLLSERHLYRVVREYVDYFNNARPHQGIEQRIPCGPAHPDRPPIDREITSRPVLGGLHYEYGWQISRIPCYH